MPNELLLPPPEHFSKFDQAVCALYQTICKLFKERQGDADDVQMVHTTIHSKLRQYYCHSIEVELPPNTKIELYPDIFAPISTFNGQLSLVCAHNNQDYKRISFDAEGTENVWFIEDDIHGRIPLNEEILYQLLMGKLR